MGSGEREILSRLALESCGSVTAPERWGGLQMKWLIAGMRKEFVEDFVRWMRDNGIRVTEPFELSGIWEVMYMPIGREQKEKCERYIEYRCNNDLM